MSGVMVELDEELVAVLEEVSRPVQRAAKELIVFELYRRAVISSGKAARLLGTSPLDFIRQASALGIPYGPDTAEELEADLRRLRSL